MTTLLHIESSAQRAERSLTRMLGREFFAAWQSERPNDVVLLRDLAVEPVEPIDADWIAAAFTPPAQRDAAMTTRLAGSDRIIEQVAAADVLVMGVPMYNYGIPGALKCWIDQSARIGKTFSFDLARGDVPIEPILSGKTLVVLTARGEFGFAPGGMRAHMNALDPQLAACAHYWGVARDDIHTVTIEYQEFKDARFTASVEAAKAEAAALAQRLARRSASAPPSRRAA